MNDDIFLAISSVTHKISGVNSVRFSPVQECERLRLMGLLSEAMYMLQQSTTTKVERTSETIKNFSDGYHTFAELYRFRMLYHAAWINESGSLFNAHKSWCHHDGQKCFGGGWFIVMAQLPTGQISNHYEAKYWGLFDVPERVVADEWDGHDSEAAANRLFDFIVSSSKSLIAKPLSDYKE